MMSRHAREQWVARVGGDPPGDVMPLLDECVIIQEYRDYYTSRGRVCCILELRWHVDKNIIFKIDTKHGKVVTVLTEKARCMK